MNKNDIIVPVVLSPTLASSVSYSYVLSLIETYHESLFSKFLSNYYTNCFFDSTYFDLYEEDVFFVRNNIFKMEKFTFSLTNNECKEEEIFQAIISHISRGYCILVHWDEFYVKDSVWYQKKNVDREHMIYGINPKTKTIHIMSLCDGKCASYCFTFEEYLFILKKFNFGICQMIFFCFNKNNKLEIDLLKIKNDLYDYLYSTNRKSFFDHDSVFYGINAIKALVSYSRKNLISNIEGLLLNYKVVYEHKKAMIIRIQYLSSNHFINKKWEIKYMEIFEKYIWKFWIYFQEFEKEKTSFDLFETAADYLLKGIASERMLLEELINEELNYV